MVHLGRQAPPAQFRRSPTQHLQSLSTFSLGNQVILTTSKCVTPHSSCLLGTWPLHGTP